MAATTSMNLVRLAMRAAELGAGGALRDTLEAIVIEAAKQLIEESFEAGNPREGTARYLAEQVDGLVKTYTHV